MPIPGMTVKNRPVGQLDSNERERRFLAVSGRLAPQENGDDQHPGQVRPPRHRVPAPPRRPVAAPADHPARTPGGPPSLSLLPRPSRMDRRRPRRLGAVGGAVSGQRQRRLPQQSPPAPQVAHGHPRPRTTAGAADPDRLGGGPTSPHRRAARCGRTDPTRRGVHRRRHAPAPGGAEDPDHRPRLAEDPETGARRDVSFEEHRGFWTWAAVEVLRHNLIRIEELTELSHHSLIQYRLPSTGELIPLLQIVPSKTDAERLLVIPPELADVLSTIVARIGGDRPDAPLVVSYDKNERVYNPPVPLLF